MLQQTFAVNAPRPAPALERRRKWEQAHLRRLATSDVLVLLSSIGAGMCAVLGESGSLRPERALNSGVHAVVLGTAWVVLLSCMHSRGHTVLGSGVEEYRRVAHAGGLALAVFAACGILLEWEGMRAILFIVWPIAVLGLLLSRILWRRWLHRRQLEGRYVCRTLVVGLEDDVRYVIDSLQAGGERSFQVIGALLLEPNAPAWIETGQQRVPSRGGIDSVAEMAAMLEADRIVVASVPPDRPGFVKQLSWQLEGTAAELVLSHRITDVVGPRVSFRPVDGLPLLHVRIPSYGGGKHLFKRALDLCVALVALAPIALLTPVLAALITLDSPGPVFYRQERLGRDGRRFMMVKFRTMRAGAESELSRLVELNQGAGPLFKMRHDPRVTRVGRFLRRFSLDELPQFWNVLLGDMSVVGPRPPLPAEAHRYDAAVTRRLYIKPGITGLWQVSGRSDLSWDESVRLDLRYVENWSLLQDVQIMWRTARVMFRPVGAY